MSNQNDFLPFCPTDTGTNLISEADYLVATGRTSGNIPGVASSALNNRALRQGTYVVSQLAQFISNTLAQDVLDNATPSDLLAQIAATFGSFTPTGALLPYSGASAPNGFLLADGSAVSQTTYANLFAVCGTTYNTGGEGSGNFRLPNAKGIFLRGAGSQTISGISYAGTLGAYQGDQIQGHYHGVGSLVNSTSAVSGTIAYGLAAYFGVSGSTDQSYGQSTNQPLNQEYNSPFSLTAAAQTISGDTGAEVTDGSNGTPRVGTQTRPANLAVTYIIKT